MGDTDPAGALALDVRPADHEAGGVCSGHLGEDASPHLLWCDPDLHSPKKQTLCWTVSPKLLGSPSPPGDLGDEQAVWQASSPCRTHSETKRHPAAKFHTIISTALPWRPSEDIGNNLSPRIIWSSISDSLGVI